MANNKRRLILALAFNKLADLLASAKTTLPALLLSLSAPVWMVAWLVPIRESGALLPQAFIGVYLRKHEARHHVWRLGMALQICAITTTLLAALVLSGVAAGAVVLPLKIWKPMSQKKGNGAGWWALLQRRQV